MYICFSFFCIGRQREPKKTADTVSRISQLVNGIFPTHALCYARQCMRSAFCRYLHGCRYLLPFSSVYYLHDSHTHTQHTPTCVSVCFSFAFFISHELVSFHNNDCEIVFTIFIHKRYISTLISRGSRHFTGL